jgi:hypothetical protein
VNPESPFPFVSNERIAQHDGVASVGAGGNDRQRTAGKLLDRAQG